MVPGSVGHSAVPIEACLLMLFGSSSFINNIPMVFAFRIVDCFFCMGPRVLFQVGYVSCLVELADCDTVC